MSNKKNRHGPKASSLLKLPTPPAQKKFTPAVIRLGQSLIQLVNGIIPLLRQCTEIEGEQGQGAPDARAVREALEVAKVTIENSLIATGMGRKVNPDAPPDTPIKSEPMQQAQPQQEAAKPPSESPQVAPQSTNPPKS